MPSPRPPFDEKDAERIVRDVYGLDGSATEMPSYDDRNFRIDTKDAQYTLKVSMLGESPALLDMQDQVMQRLAECSFDVPAFVATVNGERITELVGRNGGKYLARLQTFLPGTLLAETRPQSLQLMRGVGESIGEVALALKGFEHVAMDREFKWDLLQTQGFATRKVLGLLDEPRKELIEFYVQRFDDSFYETVRGLRKSVVHNDANDYNMLAESTLEGQRISGLFDFGDVMKTATVVDVAITAAYTVMEQERPLNAVAEIVGGFHSVFPLQEEEVAVLFDLVCLRLCTSACYGAEARANEPENVYISVHEKGAWRLLEEFRGSRSIAYAALRHACGFDRHSETASDDSHTKEELLAERNELLGPSLSVAYEDPLKIVRGKGTFLYDENGREYLDCVNNVCHVGHCHPRVVEAGQRQMAVLNTNTRYLHDNIVQYANRLMGKFPDPLEVVLFVNSGSEANELALRMALSFTGAKDVVVIDGAYHGNTSSLIDISPYKFDGAGGHGKPDHVHVATVPDPYRGDGSTGEEFAEDVRFKCKGHEVGAFFAEPMLGCGGQIVLPDGYLQSAFQHVRDAGALCVADEVQTGFGRVGSHFWAFETQGVVPDIVTMGKPMGNGHPLAAVVTTREIADAFAGGMEYFNTFGGNPVSCAIGLAVLDVIEDEGLQENALQTGQHLMDGLCTLQERHALIGDVRGLGLCIGVELVRDRETLEPAAAEAVYIVNRLRGMGVLVSVDGPLHNVLKIKPPLVFRHADANRLVSALGEVLSDTCLAEYR